MQKSLKKKFKKTRFQPTYRLAVFYTSNIGGGGEGKMYYTCLKPTILDAYIKYTCNKKYYRISNTIYIINTWRSCE